ncbi:MAG: hypothetical protein AAF125_13265 [Chloroflexota bacterium]
MDETLHQIQTLQAERHKLYVSLSHNGNDTDRARVRRITDELAILWDRHRRELALRTHGPQSVTRRIVDDAA